jgi:Na+-driven multidrug efflux pump
MIFSLMGAVTNVLLNAAMIPVWGIEGAAVATLITQVISNVLYPCLFKETREFVYCSLDGLIFRPFWPKL